MSVAGSSQWAQMWKQKEFAAAQVHRLQEDELLVLACNMMDDTIRKLPVPKALSVFTDETSFIHKQDLLPAGLVVVAKDAEDACNESAATFQWPLISSFRSGHLKNSSSARSTSAS